MTDELAPAADVADIPEPLTGLVIVRVAGERRRLDVNIVREVVPRPAVTPLPLVPPLVAGVLNLRGEIIGVLDPSVLMQVAGARLRDFAVVIDHDDTAVAILVDSVEDVAWMTAAQQQEIARLDVPEILRHAQLHPPAGS